MYNYNVCEIKLMNVIWRRYKVIYLTVSSDFLSRSTSHSRNGSRGRQFIYWYGDDRK